MAEDKPKDLVDDGAVLPGLDFKDVALVDKEAPAPKGMTIDEMAQLKARARAIARQLQEADGSAEMVVLDSLATLGMQSQRQAAADVGLLKARVGDMFSQQDPTGWVATDLVELRVALQQIAPDELRQPRLFQMLLNILPYRRRLLRLLEKIATRYEPLSRQIVVIETRLRQGRKLLARDNMELRKLYEQVESQQPAVQRSAYLGELLIRELQELMDQTSDSRKRERFQSALHDVAMRVQDLRAIGEVHSQFFVSIDMTRQNNTRLSQAVERTLMLAANVVTVGLVIQAALVRQKQVLDATRRTREFLGDMIVVNAETIKRHTREIGDVYNEPVIAVEKIALAHDALLEAIDMADNFRQEGIAAARDNISRLSRLAGTLEARFVGMREVNEERSLEA